MSRLCLTVGVVCLGLWGCSAVAFGAPARFWFSFSPDHPLPITNSSGTLEAELTRAPTIDDRDGLTLYLWAQPGTDTAGQRRQLQSLTLNIVTTQPLVNLDAATIENPSFQIAGNPPHSQARFESVRDSCTIVPHNPGLTLSSKSPSEIVGGTADRMDNMLAASPSLMGVTPGAGFGPTPITGDATYEMTSQGPVWRLGSVRVESLTSTGEVPIHLQIGSSGVRHADGTTSSTDVIFAPPGKAGPVYNAGPQTGPEGDYNLDGTINYAFRNKTLTGDVPDALIRIVDGIPGDFNKDGQVDARDYTVWRNGYGERYGHDHYLTWKENYGRGTAGSRGSSLSTQQSQVPEPTSLAVTLGFMVILLLWNAQYAASQKRWLSFGDVHLGYEI